MVEIAVKSGAAWFCADQGHHLASALILVHVSDEDTYKEELSQSEGDKTNCCSPVLLEQAVEGSPCVLTIQCSPSSLTAINRLLVISEARTMELYNQTGEYCGTVRGEKDDSIQSNSEDRGPFYRKQLILEQSSSACEVKLLSLAGRSSILVHQVIVGLQPLHHPCPVHSAGIDMQQVQCLVEEIGTSLSPRAQNLMDMVHFQQKNQTSSVGGFLPLLMGGGVFSALTQGANSSPAFVRNRTQSAEPTPLVSFSSSADEAPPTQNETMSNSSIASSPDWPLSSVNTKNTVSGDSRCPVSHAQLAQMMSHFLKSQDEVGQALTSGPELLPMLQSVCGQVTQLRLDDATAEKEKRMRNGTWECDSAMERRLEEMERRLKEHMDHRLDILEQKLEKALLSALPLVALNHRGLSSSAGGPSSTEQTGQTPAIQ